MSTHIKLNVGGMPFETTKETLLQADYFIAMLNGSWAESHNIDDPIFIDRDGEGFKHVLCLLRYPNYLFPHNRLFELDFYGIAREGVSIQEDMDEKMKEFELLKAGRYKCAYSCNNWAIPRYTFCNKHVPICGFISKYSRRCSNKIQIGFSHPVCVIHGYIGPKE